LIERWFREITDKCLRRGTFLNVRALIDTIRAFIDEHNANPKSFVWTAQDDEIIEKIARAREVSNKTPSA
jgi:hypothetical protein